MGHESVVFQFGFYAYVAVTVLCWIAAFAAGWWLARTVKRYRR